MDHTATYVYRNGSFGIADETGDYNKLSTGQIINKVMAIGIRYSAGFKIGYFNNCPGKSFSDIVFYGSANHITLLSKGCCVKKE